MLIRCLHSLLVIVVILCGCAKHHESNIFKTELPEGLSKIKTYTYKEALDLAEDSEGFYNFFLLPGIDPAQAYAFEQKLAKEWGFGYNVYTGAHPHTVETLVYVNVPVALLKAYIETLVAHISAKKTDRLQTLRTAITYYLALRKAMQADPKKESLYFQLEAERVLLSLLLMLEDNDLIEAEHRINNAWRTLDRVKFHMYKNSLEH